MIFIDTGAFLARYLEQDQYHAVALASWERLQGSAAPCATSNLVLSETFTLLARRAGYDFAAARARLILASRVLKLLRPDAADERRALEFFEKYADQKVSFTDCLSFALMKKEKLRQAFTFDQHFEYAGFQRWS